MGMEERIVGRTYLFSLSSSDYMFIRRNISSANRTFNVLEITSNFQITCNFYPLLGRRLHQLSCRQVGEEITVRKPSRNTSMGGTMHAKSVGV